MARGTDTQFERRLASLVNAREPGVLQDGLKGVEKESLRVGPDGRIVRADVERLIERQGRRDDLPPTPSQARVQAPVAAPQSAESEVRELHAAGEPRFDGSVFAELERQAAVTPGWLAGDLLRRRRAVLHRARDEHLGRVVFRVVRAPDLAEAARHAPRSVVREPAAGPPGGAPPPPEVGVVTVTPRSVGLVVELPGRLEAYYRAPIFARVSGYVASRKADIGTRVKTGDVLAEIDAPDPDQQRDAPATARIVAAEVLLHVVGAAEQWVAAAA